MKHRFLTAAVSLAVLVLSYKVYQLLVVPILEGPQVDTAPLVPTFVSAAPKFAPNRELLRKFFPADSWERTSATVLRSDDLLLAVQHWEQLDAYRLQITPCTIVYAPENAAEEAEPQPQAQRRTWIVQAVEGAVLRMDQPSDIRRGSLGKVSAIYVPGRVRLTGSESAPGAGDALELITNNLQLNEQKIWTPHDVQVRWGDNTMQGSDLTVHLSQSKSSNQPLGLALGKTGLRSIELAHLNVLKLQLPPQAPEQAQTAANPEWLEVRCAGPLVVDLLAGLARITGQVELARTGNPRQNDQLLCDEVTARFSQWATGEDQVDTIQLERIVATGQPAVVTSRQWKDSPQGRLKPRSYEFSCPKWEYDAASGEFAASGAGRFVADFQGAAELDDDQSAASETSVVTWQRQLRWERPSENPEDREMQLVVDGSARCTSALGQVEAERVRIWLEPDTASSRRKTRTAVSTSGRPRRVLAEGKVQIRSEKLDGAAEKLDVVVASSDEAPASETSALPPDSMQLRAPANTPKVRNVNSNRYQVYGETMRVAMQKNGERWSVRDVTLDRHVRCMAFHADGNAAPRAMELEGRTLLLRDLADGEGIAHITGAPARIRAGRMQLEGPAIQLDRKQNRIWIDGAGSAAVPLPAQLASRYPQDAAFAYITWFGGLNFDGTTVACQQNVQIRGPAQLISADRLSARLVDEVDLAQQKFESSAIQLDSVIAEGSVKIENRTLGERGLESVESAQVPRLIFRYQTGDLVGEGPGYIETVRAQPANGRIPGASGEHKPLMYLRVEFQRQFAANLNKRQADFNNHVFATYGPVSDWNERINASASDPLSGGQMVMTCDQLSVFQVRGRDPRQAPMELIAQGNATIEGEQFKAEAHRMSYDQGKDLFVLEGSGRADVHLVRQAQPGGPRQETSADKILYSPKANTIQVNGMKMLDLGNLSSQTR